MNSLKSVLMGSVAAISLAAGPAIAQDTATQPSEQQQTGASERSYDSVYGDNFAGLGDRTIDELVGTELVNDAGESIGEIDNFGLAGDQIVAIVGIGGFLGMGEHMVAMPIERLSYDGEQLVISDVTREELEALPEYDESQAQAFASDQTFRSSYEAGGGEAEMAQMEPSESQAADQPMDDVEQEVAEAEADAESGITPSDELAEAEQALENTGEEAADAAEEAGDAVEEAGEEVADAAADTGAAVENAGEEAADEVAQAGEEAAQETEQMADAAEAEMSEETEMSTDMAQGDAAVEGNSMATETADAENTGQMAQDADMASEGGWTEEMDSIFADIADQQIAELIGMEVASADGEVVGEVDNFALAGEDVVAIVGIGGFLGIGEHEVALSLGDMTYDGEKLVLSSMTEEQLREMPEYDEAEANYLPEDGTLRSSYE